MNTLKSIGLTLLVIVAIIVVQAGISYLDSAPKRTLKRAERWRINVEANKDKKRDYFYTSAIIRNDTLIAMRLPDTTILSLNDFIKVSQFEDDEVFLKAKNGVKYDIKLVDKIINKPTDNPIIKAFNKYRDERNIP